MSEEHPARRAGLRVDVVPENYTVEALTAAIVRYYGSQPS